MSRNHDEVNQVDQIENSPVCLIVNWLTRKAWLLLDEYVLEDYSDMEIRQYTRIAIEWGVRPCRSQEEHDWHLTDARQKIAEVNQRQEGFRYEL